MHDGLPRKIRIFFAKEMTTCIYFVHPLKVVKTAGGNHVAFSVWENRPLPIYTYTYIRLSKQSRRRWFETPSSSLWHHCNGTHQHVYTHAQAFTSICVCTHMRTYIHPNMYTYACMRMCSKQISRTSVISTTIKPYSNLTGIFTIKLLKRR